MTVGGEKSGITWQTPPSELAKSFAAFGDRLRENLQEVGLDVAVEMEQYAKQNHPWTNRTGNAERGLNADVTWSTPGFTQGAPGGRYRSTSGRFVSAVAARVNEGLTITLAHGVNYGIWLEVRWGGRFAIILPTLQQYYGEITRRLYKLAEKA